MTQRSQHWCQGASEEGDIGMNHGWQGQPGMHEMWSEPGLGDHVETAKNQDTPGGKGSANKGGWTAEGEQVGRSHCGRQGNGR